MQSGAASGMRLMDTAIQTLLDSGKFRQRKLQEAINKSRFDDSFARFLSAPPSARRAPVTPRPRGWSHCPPLAPRSRRLHRSARPADFSY